jgi:hypothetical protein
MLCIQEGVMDAYTRGRVAGRRLHLRCIAGEVQDQDSVFGCTQCDFASVNNTLKQLSASTLSELTGKSRHQAPYA